MNIQWFGEDFKNMIQQKADAALLASSLAVQTAAKQEAPVKTGRLRDSIQVTKVADGYEVGSDLPYSLSVEIGSATTAAQPFLTLAMMSVDYSKFFRE